MLKSVFHTSWTVENLGRSIDFYCDLLGFVLIGRRERQGIEIETVVGFAKADLHIAFLRLPGAPVGISGHHLELIEYRYPRGLKLDIRTCDTGSAHLALETDTIRDDYDRLLQAGVKIVSEPVVFKSSVAGEVLACYLRDPDGFTIELVQIATPTGKEVSAHTETQGVEFSLPSTSRKGARDDSPSITQRPRRLV